ncbi:hypothetical protein LCGC14_0755160 [marine sediment metagenome]|uniref:Uncharacterized AAA domain-containing protein ycf46 n=1 Tax=marine sediment metagenome TaxID=412755 RepID=A0A0F9QMR6_9ZZZZ
MTNFTEELTAKMASKSGVVHIVEEDEYRLQTKCHQAAISQGYGCYRWTFTDGLVPISDDIKLEELELQQLAGLVDPVNGLLQAIKAWDKDPAVIVAYDLLTMVNRLPSLPAASRLIKDITEVMKQRDQQGQVQLVLCDAESPQLATPLQRMQMELPDRDEMNIIVDQILAALPEGLEAAIEEAAQNRDRILNSLAGLPAYQASNAISESIVRTGIVDASLLKDFKKELVSAKGITWIDADERGFDAIGGLTPLKNWLTMIYVAFNPEIASEYNLEPPKGVVVAGSPGSGKSALVRALGSSGVWDMPILKLDVGATRGKFQGQSEQGWNDAILACEAAAPAILWLDELEKGFEGAAASGETDGGTGARVLQSFLTWLQDRNQSGSDQTKSVFVYATANKPDRLPPEMLRAGRFDAQFWVDFPGKSERRGIIDVYCRKYDKAVDIDKDVLLKASRDCSGAEIEAAFRQAAISAMTAKLPMRTDDIKIALENVTRVKRTFKVEGALKAWKEAAQRANDPEEATVTTAPKVRRLSSLK